MYKRFLTILAILPLVAVMVVYAGPPITQGINLGNLGAITASSITDTGLTASLPVFTDGSKVLTSNGMTGTGNVVMSNNATLAGPNLGAANATSLTTTSLTNSGLTANRVLIGGVGGLLGDNSNLTFLVDTLTATKISSTLVTLNNVSYYANSATVADEDTWTLPTVTANWTGRGTLRFSTGNTVAESAEFETGSDGLLYQVRGSANVVQGASCADAKICVGNTASTIKWRHGAGNAMVEFWYR